MNTGSTDKKYNGWANYETWNVKLWLDNDESSQEYWRENTIAALALGRTRKPTYDSQTPLDIAKYELAEMLKDAINEANPLAGDASMYTDLLGAALSEVNWYEIAEAYLEDLNEE